MLIVQHFSLLMVLLCTPIVLAINVIGNLLPYITEIVYLCTLG